MSQRQYLPRRNGVYLYSGTERTRIVQAGCRAWIFSLVAASALLFFAYPPLPAGAQETPGVEVGDGTVRMGDDVFAGNGCARAGDVAAGDCGERSETQHGDESADKNGNEKDTGEETKPPEKISSESTGNEITGETTVQETTGSGLAGDYTTGVSGGTTQAVTTLSTTSGTTSEAVESCPTAPPEDATQATVERAVDGDTVELQEPVDGYDKVRLIGVDTPELEGEDGSPEPGAEKASEFTADALEGEKVVLQTEKEAEDPYGRLLADVWLVPETGEPEFFNRTLIADGHAEVLTVEPNDAYAECLSATEQQAGEETTRSEEARQGDGGNEGLLGRIQDLLSSDTPNDRADADEPMAPGDQYVQSGSTDGVTVKEQSDQPSSETTERGSPTTTETTAGLTGSTPEAEDLATVPPENCPGASVVLEPFEAEKAAQSDPFEVTGGTFVVRADLKSEDSADAHLDVSILDTESQESVDEFDQKTLGAYDILISQGPGSYLLNLQSTAGSYEVAVFDCANDKPEPSSPETSNKEPGARLDLGSSTPPAPQSGGDEPATGKPAEIGLAVDEPIARADEAESPIPALPTQDTPSGEVDVLPDTGGPLPGTVLLAGVFAITVGVAGLILSVGFGRKPGSRSGVDGS